MSTTTISVTLSKTTGAAPADAFCVSCSLERSDDCGALTDLESLRRAAETAVTVCQERLREEAGRRT